MVKSLKKANKTPTNNINIILTENKTSLKPKQQIDKEYYQKNKERKKVQQKEKYLKKKEQSQLSTKQQSAKYYGAEAIKVLISFKEYTELNQSKHKLWLDFNWTMKDCAESIKEGLGNIVAIMKLEQVASNLVRDYWETAKQEIKKGKSWNSLDQEQQDRLIRYWGYEKVRIENGYIDPAEQLERQSQEYLKEIELAKFHEERGKVKCPCYACEEKKQIQAEIKAEQKKIINNYEQGQTDKEQCPECSKWVKELDEESGACKGCKRKYE